MEKINIKNIMESCANAAKLKAFNWISPPEHLKEQVEHEQRMYENRLGLCSNCPIFDNGICNSSRSIVIGDRTFYGCGCLISCKAALEENRCPASKW